MMQGDFNGATRALASLMIRAEARQLTQTGETRALLVTQAWIDLERRAYGAVLRRLADLPVEAGNPLTADRELVLGAALCGLGKHQEGQSMMAVSLDGHLQLTHPDSPVLAYLARASGPMCARRRRCWPGSQACESSARGLHRTARRRLFLQSATARPGRRPRPQVTTALRTRGLATWSDEFVRLAPASPSE